LNNNKFDPKREALPIVSHTERGSNPGARRYLARLFSTKVDDPNRQRHPRPGLAAAAAVLLALLVGLAVAAAKVPMTSGETSVAPPKVGWVNECLFDHRTMDDPIAFPKEPGAAHLHDFSGNTTTDAYSTHESLLQGGTSCEHAADTAAYWTPTLLLGGKAIAFRENKVDFYYRSRTSPLSDVQPFPAGLKIIAGSPHATDPKDTRAVDWDCEDGGSDQDTNHPVDCGTGYVSADIKFPDCWDGARLDSHHHKGHMAYSIEGKDGRFECPESHPVAVPRLIFSVEWEVHDGTSIELSSGPYYTMHADFINSWQPGALEDLVTRCINAAENCGRVG
jgi:Domain of unknown function (DUF1996)